jgi:hypothetical protein
MKTGLMKDLALHISQCDGLNPSFRRLAEFVSSCGIVIERPVEDHLLIGEAALFANREVRVLAEQRARVAGSAAAV